MRRSRSRRIASAVCIALLASVVTVGAVGVEAASAAAGGTSLHAGEQMSNQQYIHSPDGLKRLIMQSDGNLVLYYRAGGSWSVSPRVAWQTNTDGNSNARLVMQGDGNLVIYTPTNAVLWATYTFGNNYLTLQDDGNLVVYRTGGGALWNANVFSNVLAATFNEGSGNPPYAGYPAAFAIYTRFIGDQEACEARLSQTNDPVPMTKSFGAAKTGCGASGPHFGNDIRVVWRGTPAAALTHHYTQTDPDGQARSAICQRGNLNGQRAVVCSSHLTVGSGTAYDDVRRSQQSELLDFVASIRVPGDLMIISADFNSVTTSRMDANTLGLRRMTDPSIDQIWSNGEPISTTTTVPCAPDPRCSDHDIRYAWIG